MLLDLPFQRENDNEEPKNPMIGAYSSLMYLCISPVAQPIMYSLATHIWRWPRRDEPQSSFWTLFFFISFRSLASKFWFHVARKEKRRSLLLKLLYCSVRTKPFFRFSMSSCSDNLPQIAFYIFFSFIIYSTCVMFDVSGETTFHYVNPNYGSTRSLYAPQNGISSTSFTSPLRTCSN